MGAKMAEGMAKQSGALLLGRRTHENFYASWPRPTDNPYTDRLNKTTKYVASRTLTEPLPWSNSILLGCDAAGAIAELKQQPIGGLTMTGSGELIGSLLATSETDVTVAVEPRFAPWPQPVCAPPLTLRIVSFRPGAVERRP